MVRNTNNLIDVYVTVYYLILSPKLDINVLFTFIIISMQQPVGA